MIDISIIVPVYNVAAYLSQCINSIRNQTYKSWELILVDDGSKDESGELCDKFAEMDERIKVIHIQNSGVSTARNIGLQNAKGIYVAFVDGDDWIEPDMYEKLIVPMNAGADITFCRFVREYPKGTVLHVEQNLETFVKRPFDFGQIVYEYELENTDRQTLSNTVFGSVCRSLFKKKVIDRENIDFTVNVKIAEDRLFLMEYLLYCHRAAMVDFYGYHYRAEREGSAITSNTEGYQANLYERRKGMLELEIPIIEKNNRLTKKERDDLIIYEKYRLCFDTAINEILFQPEYKQRLNDIFKDLFIKNVLSFHAFVHMREYGFSLKRRILYMMIGLRSWRMIKYILTGRRREKTK